MHNILYLIYDGDCILCRNSAQALKIKKTVGHLEIINARSCHPMVIEAKESGYDLNEGILVKFKNKYYYGNDAIHFLALISNSSDVFNKMTSFIFKSKVLSICLYPVFKSFRKTLLFIQGLPPITNHTQKPLIDMLYGKFTENVPKILQRRYLNRPYSRDYVVLKGEINIFVSKIFRFVFPMFRLVGALVPYPATKIPVKVEFISNEKSNAILMRRTFYYKDKAPYCFTSRVIHIKKNVAIELMRFGFASRLIYLLNENKIIMDYGGYVFRLGKWLIPIPISFLVGKFYSYEEANLEGSFTMEAKMVHPLFGRIFQYDGYFTIAESDK